MLSKSLLAVLFFSATVFAQGGDSPAPDAQADSPIGGDTAIEMTGAPDIDQVPAPSPTGPGGIPPPVGPGGLPPPFGNRRPSRIPRPVGPGALPPSYGNDSYDNGYDHNRNNNNNNNNGYNDRGNNNGNNGGNYGGRKPSYDDGGAVRPIYTNVVTITQYPPPTYTRTIVVDPINTVTKFIDVTVFDCKVKPTPYGPIRPVPSYY
ncbi:hypothetical protein AYI69_g264 [Smittium culicis]|uniref:Uncharacterized protein n=1 Tax=Smittium culicis TaxID=133412 RepID=A0A1R1YTI1_9FUNG|nr:hypothetical protein AYI69_g264 [Smittium culicis]